MVKGSRWKERAWGILTPVAEGVFAVVTAVFGPLVRVQVGEETLVVPFRRRLRWCDEESDRRLVVGDHVGLDGVPPAVVVTEVQARRTVLRRRSPGERRSRVIAANIDQAVVVVTGTSPEPNPRLLDRLLVACHHARIAPLICVNKIDKGLGELADWIEDYQKAAYQVLFVSARTARGLGSLQRAIVGRTTLFCGPSGVGKSALLNAIHPGYKLREASISEATGKGRHTTTTAHLLPLPDAGFVVDTPGVKEFGFWDLSAQTLPELFPDVAGWGQGCAHGDCRHVDDEGCAVRAAAGREELSPRRYESYVKLRLELEETESS
jgi:ribosome biogenesis GTPase / thiamine phosphate phosphatase